MVPCHADITQKNSTCLNTTVGTTASLFVVICCLNLTRLNKTTDHIRCHDKTFNNKWLPTKRPQRNIHDL